MSKSLTKKSVKEMDNEKLFTELCLVLIRSTKEANSSRGVTKVTLKEEELLVKECSERFNFNFDEIIKKVNI